MFKYGPHKRWQLLVGLFWNAIYSRPAGMVTAVIRICCPVVRIHWDNCVLASFKLTNVKNRTCYVPFRIKTRARQGSRHRAVTASINVPSFFAWLKSELRSSSSTTDWYTPERSLFLVSSLGTMCSSPRPPLALLRTMVLKRTLAEPDMWDALKDRKERQSSTRQPGTLSSNKPRRDAESMVGTSMMTIVGRRDRNVKSKYIKLVRWRDSLSCCGRKILFKSYEGNVNLWGGESFVPVSSFKETKTRTQTKKSFKTVSKLVLSSSRAALLVVVLLLKIYISKFTVNTFCLRAASDTFIYRSWVWKRRALTSSARPYWLSANTSTSAWRSFSPPSRCP